jgi:hypothetical protein
MEVRIETSEKILATYYGKEFNVAPLLKVLLEDRNRPEDFIKFLKHLLEADITHAEINEKPVSGKFASRRYFIKCLIKSIKEGLKQSN